MQIRISLLLVTLSYFTLPAQDTIRILPLGNSITQGENQGSDNYNSWRRQLYFDLGTIITAPDTFDFIGSTNLAFPAVPFPDSDFDQDHEGHWGWRADEIQSNLSSWLTNLDTPDLVLMHLGSNDCFGGQSIASTMAELEAIIDTLRLFSPAVTTFVAQLIPTNRAENVCISELNDSIPGLAFRKDLPGSPVIVVDQNTGFDEVMDTYDNIHPNVQGEMKIATRWFNALQPIIANLLPLNLLNFSAEVIDQSIKLSWRTANESGIEGFTVQKSRDLNVFDNVGFKSAVNAGTNSESSYTLFDSKPLIFGKAYYRLQIKEVDGRIKYSNIKEVSIRNSTVHLFPTVVKKGDPIYLKDQQILPLVVSDLSGLRFELEVEGTSLSLPRLTPGLYFVQGYSQSGVIWTEKIIIQ